MKDDGEREGGANRAARRRESIKQVGGGSDCRRVTAEREGEGGERGCEILDCDHTVLYTSAMQLKFCSHTHTLATTKFSVGTVLIPKKYRHEIKGEG